MQSLEVTNIILKLEKYKYFRGALAYKDAGVAAVSSDFAVKKGKMSVLLPVVFIMSTHLIDKLIVLN